jgi:PucR-like helix-turn-helix protein
MASSVGRVTTSASPPAHLGTVRQVTGAGKPNRAQVARPRRPGRGAPRRPLPRTARRHPGALTVGAPAAGGSRARGGDRVDAADGLGRRDAVGRRIRRRLQPVRTRLRLRAGVPRGLLGSRGRRPDPREARRDRLRGPRTVQVRARHEDAARDRTQQKVQLLVHYDDRRGNVVATSRALFIHPNTLRQRLDRIRRVSGIEVDREDWLSFAVATKVVKLRRMRRAAAGKGRNDG